MLERFELPTGWRAELRADEEIRWVNEWKAPSELDRKHERPLLHDNARGFYLCPSCGQVLEVPVVAGKTAKSAAKGRKKAAKAGARDPFGHAPSCARLGEPPRPRAITTRSKATTLRIVVHLPPELDETVYQTWGQSLGYSLRTGMRQLYMLDGPEIEFVLEPVWETKEPRGRKGALTFVDSAVGGSGFLERAAEDLHLVAARTMEHLDHKDCDSACYRCLKSYQNQRHHEHLSWPQVMPDLEQLKERAPRRLPEELGDKDDPGPWLEAYDAGVGSPLELKFLRLFEAAGLGVEKQVPISVDGRAITVADFASKERKIAIYVDGAAFHTGQRLRRDRAIRRRLQESDCCWTVIELRAADLAKGAWLASEILRGGEDA